MFYLRAERQPLEVEDIQLGLVEFQRTPPEAVDEGDAGADDPARRPARAHPAPEPLSERHPEPRHHLWHRPGRHRQTYLAVASAVDAMESDAVKRIVLVRPAVEAGENWAFCPAIWRRKSIPICARCTTRCMT